MIWKEIFNDLLIRVSIHWTSWDAFVSSSSFVSKKNVDRIKKFNHFRSLIWYFSGKKLLWFHQRACTTVFTPKCTHTKVTTENDNGYKEKEDFNLTDLIIELVIIFHLIWKGPILFRRTRSNQTIEDSLELFSFNISLHFPQDRMCISIVHDKICNSMLTRRV